MANLPGGGASDVGLKLLLDFPLIRTVLVYYSEAARISVLKQAQGRFQEAVQTLRKLRAHLLPAFQSAEPTVHL